MQIAKNMLMPFEVASGLMNAPNNVTKTKMPVPPIVIQFMALSNKVGWPNRGLSMNWDTEGGRGSEPIVL